MAVLGAAVGGDWFGVVLCTAGIILVRQSRSRPPLVMAGLDPPIQPRRHTAVARMGWMAASRAAMPYSGSVNSFPHCGSFSS
jgi:hypothetical protein